MIHFVTVPGFLVLVLLIELPVGLLEKFLEGRGIDPGGSALFSAAALLCQIAILLTVPVLLFFGNREARKRSVALESSRWLAEHQARISAGERKSRERGIRWSLWIPSLMVLAVFLFLPEVWGLLTHMQRPQAGRLLRYDVTVPPTWIIVSSRTSFTEGSWVNGIAWRGMGLGVKRYLHFGDLPVSSWGVGFTELDEPELRPSNRDDAVARRDFQIGRAKLTCFEYRLSRSRPMRAGAEPLALIYCSGSDRLSAKFIGDRIQASAFYGMLAKMTPGLPPEIK